jgi:hypothetical protein
MKKILQPRSIIVLAVLVVSIVGLALFLPAPRAAAQYKANQKHAVTLDSAAKYIQNFKKHPVAPTIQGGFFGRNIFDKILAQPGLVGIRYYYAAKDDGSPTLVLVGVDSTGDDMVQGVIAEYIWPCPPLCSSSNALNK